MSPFQPGDVIGGRYRLVRVMGAGAMGVVWSARNESTERDFAIKLMLPEAAKDPQRLQRFFKEAKLAGRLRHRCIVEVYDLGRIERGPYAGSPYLVMELLDGEPLDALLRRVGRLPAGTALRIVRDVARGLSVAHEQGVVHRDLKPANVFLHRTLEGTTVPKILDFGISKLVTPAGEVGRDGFDPQETTVGTILGSPAYMSPEQTSGEDLDPRADLWSLGVVLYKALSGALPFLAANFTHLMLAINTQDPKPLEERVPGLPKEVYAIVHRCLSRRRGDRFSSAAALAEAIDAVLDAHELPILELSLVVAGVVPVPSEHMKTLQLDGAPSANAPFGTTAPLGDTRPVAETRSTERALADTRPLGDTRPALSADATGAHATSLSREAVLAPEPGPRSRAIVASVAAAIALVAVGLLIRARTADPTDPKPTFATKPPIASVSVAASAAPEAPIPGAPPHGDDAEPSPSSAIAAMPTSGAPTSKPHAPATKPYAPSKLAPKAKPKPPKSATTAPPHEGLVRPGF